MTPSNNNNGYEDRSAIRQALAILEQEGVYLGNTDLDYDFDASPPNVSSFIDRNRRSKSTSRRSNHNHKQVPQSPVTFNKPNPILPHVPYSKFAEDSSDSSSNNSFSGSSGSTSSSSLSPESNREVGGKAKRSLRKLRSRRNSSKSEKTKTQKESKTPVKSVKFSNYDHTVFIPHILDFTPEEIEQCWMDEEDYRSIRSRSLTLIEMMEDEKKYPISADYMIVNKHLVCVRGLGEKTSQCTRELERIQRKLYKAVFRAQEELKEESVEDPEALRKASRKYSTISLKTARFVGISDEVNVSSKFG